MALALKIGRCTLKGHYRDANEDAIAVCHFSNVVTCLVADGMGGQGAGEIASQHAVTLIARELRCALAPNASTSEAHHLIRRAISHANEDLIAMQAQRGDGRRMASTIVAVVWSGAHEVHVTHLGDSRAYLVRARRIHRLTQDHDLVQALIDAGQFHSRQEANDHRVYNVLHLYLGIPQVGDGPEVRAINVLDGDRLLLCTDGLSSYLTDEMLEQFIIEHPIPEECAQGLCQLALDNYGRDNVSAIVIELADNGLPSVVQPRTPSTSLSWPDPIAELALSLNKGQPCHFALHDALLETGHPDLAEHFLMPEHLPDCWALRTILDERS
jgi:protein phosphatase